ncbi:Oxaloacetate decarboxylase, gamma chain [Desulfocicer vacuolatum DSM 3385]|uniref:Oxaloacetate decarboxylase, gamma chain n=1 Tax=Desulfocicer vacuolatum DSM 3385 TaxID=1121400 RepID=A0A1W2EBA9_9BACT|nr:OadG family protein [Desulfocicer vacuolatum]SMD06368.1 Oxaloacetate decarboxylase, gamma chain [Desulfocicer vacuolatum DSM 3385]
MYGVEAISINNGWAISVVGVSIVFTGLMLLSLSISRLHKILNIWDNRNDLKIFRKKTQEEPQNNLLPFTEKNKISAYHFRLLIKTMDDPFSLQRLLYLAKISGLDRPHSNLCRLIKAGIIKSDHKGKYFFNREAFNKLAS